MNACDQFCASRIQIFEISAAKSEQRCMTRGLTWRDKSEIATL